MGVIDSMHVLVASQLAATNLLDAVPSILGFGMLGLSFLLVFLGYLLLRQAGGTANPSTGHLWNCRFFMLMAFLFMVAAGLIHFWQREVQIFLVVSPELAADLEMPKASAGGQYIPFERGRPAALLVTDHKQINIHLDALAREISNLRAAIGAQARERVQQSANMATTMELGPDDGI